MNASAQTLRTHEDGRDAEDTGAFSTILPIAVDSRLQSVAEARHELRRRRVRLEFFYRHNLGDGHWAILLDLFVCKFDGNEVSITSSCHASGLPSTTALRCISALIEIGMVRRTAHPNDGRSSILELTPEGERILAEALRYLQAMNERATDKDCRCGR